MPRLPLTDASEENTMKRVILFLATNLDIVQPLLDKMAAFGIAGGRGTGLKRLFMTHPPLEERIAALREGTAS